VSDLERRVEIEPIQALLAERRELIAELAPLRAKYGAGGTWDALRKIEVATCAHLARLEAAKSGTKVTESFLEETAHSSDRYADFVATATAERIRWVILEAQVEAVDARINRGQALARFAAAELHLTP
jgi:hypothetical protein